MTALWSSYRHSLKLQSEQLLRDAANGEALISVISDSRDNTAK